MRTALLVLTLLAACTCPPPEAPAPAPAPPGPGPGAEQPPPEQPPAEAERPAQGDKCQPDTGCAEGLTCVSYYGVAGPSGPQFHSCEIPCGEGTPACPDGQNCITIADGPGQVCRPAEPPATP